MKRKLAILAAAMMLCGCTSNSEISRPEPELPRIIDELHTDAPEQDNGYVKYRMVQNSIPEGREIQIPIIGDNIMLTLTANSFSASGERLDLTIHSCYPLSLTERIGEYFSDDPEEYNCPMYYHKQNGISAILQSYKGDNYKLTYGNGEMLNRVEFTTKHIVSGMQMTENAFYCFSRASSYDNADIVVTAVTTDNGGALISEDNTFNPVSVAVHTVPFAAMGVDELKGLIEPGDMFVHENVLYFCSYNSGWGTTIYVCDLDTMKGTNIYLEDMYCGRLFTDSGRVGLMTLNDNDWIEQKIHWFDFDRVNMKLTPSNVIPVQLPDLGDEISYNFDIYGYDFFYIDGTLCGILMNTEPKKENYAYVEINAFSGETETFVPYTFKRPGAYRFLGYTVGTAEDFMPQHGR